VVYSLDKEEQDALDNTIISDIVEIEELKAALPSWLHELIGAFLKRAVNTLP
jgi:hypothetical protein